MGGPSSGMAHFPFTKRAETQTSTPFASHRPRHSLHASIPSPKKRPPCSKFGSGETLTLPQKKPRGSAPRANGRAFLRHGPFSIHKTRRNTNQPPFCLAPPSPFLARLHSVYKNCPPYSFFGSRETLTLPQIIRATARLVPLGGPSSGMAHFQFTKGAAPKSPTLFSSPDKSTQRQA